MLANDSRTETSPSRVSHPRLSSRDRNGSPGKTRPRTANPASMRPRTRRAPIPPAAPVTRTFPFRMSGPHGYWRNGPVDWFPIAHRQLARSKLPNDGLLAGQAVFSSPEGSREGLARRERAGVVLRNYVHAPTERARQLRAEARGRSPPH